jgi:DNA-directed RNA polymerase specialized sigma24 family protein
MIATELDAWWEGHPRSVRLAVTRYRPRFIDAGDFESELYVFCRSQVGTYEQEHPVSHWLCQRARDLCSRIKHRSAAAKRDHRIPVVEIDAPCDDTSLIETLAAPQYQIDAVLDLERAFSSTRLSQAQRAVLEGTACGFTSAELADALGTSRISILRLRCQGRKVLAAALGH